MGLRAAVRAAALTRPATFLVSLPGATAVRLAVEAEVRRRGWSSAAAPAAANLLVVVGGPGPDAAAWLDGVWQAVPKPRDRVRVADACQVSAVLDAGRQRLATGTGTEDGRARSVHELTPTGNDGNEARHDLRMAERADDRDGLRLDRLHVPLGPALADWPSGLVLHLALQGDVIQEARAEATPPPREPVLPYWNEPWLRARRGEQAAHDTAARRRCAAHLDSLGRVLAVAGWPGPAARARRLRDEVLGAAPATAVRPALRALTRTVRRSRTLRLLTAGLGPLPADRAAGCGVSGPARTAGGDVHDRVLTWLTETEATLDHFDDPRPLLPRDAAWGPRGRVDGPLPPSRALLDVLPGLLVGTEFAAARLIVASLDPDLDEAVAGPRNPHRAEGTDPAGPGGPDG
ncbi:hypothetical protein [Streptomyces sp. NPDC003077]|uniref:hypothetical protein n=1 Tax=Streptomyces sp. NPDC003077 TaxID=3154443 RepID=UPI0033A7ECEB